MTMKIMMTAMMIECECFQTLTDRKKVVCMILLEESPMLHLSLQLFHLLFSGTGIQEHTQINTRYGTLYFKTIMQPICEWQPFVTYASMLMS